MLFQYLDDQIATSEFERWVYQQTNLEKLLDESDYQFLLAFNYRKKDAKYEIRKFILENIISKNEFVRWKFEALLNSAEIKFPTDDLYAYAKRFPKFLRGKSFCFQELLSKKVVEIEWAEEVTPFVRHASILQLRNEKYLYLGTYEDSYIHLVVNRRNEIWIAYDVINHEDFFAPNIYEAFKKLILGSD